MEETEVAVIGAGLSGLCAALSLARLGRRVTIIDRKCSLDQRVHTTGIFVRRTLEDFHIPEELLGPAVRDVVLYSPAGRAMLRASPAALLISAATCSRPRSKAR